MFWMYWWGDGGVPDTDSEHDGSIGEELCGQLRMEESWHGHEKT